MMLFDSALKQIVEKKEREFSSAIHERTMCAVRSNKLWQRVYSVGMVGVLASALLIGYISGHLVVVHALETDAPQFVRLVIESASLDIGSLGDFSEMVFEFFPQTWSIVFALDLLIGVALFAWELRRRSQQQLSI